MTPTPTPEVRPVVSRPVGIDVDAPVVSRHEVLAAAPLPSVWQLHTDVAGRPAWNTGSDATQPEGPLTPGSSSRRQTGGLDITSTVTEVEEQHRTVWGGPAHGITGVHVWTSTDTGAGVLVRTEESWDGDAVRSAVPTLQAALDASLVSWLADPQRTAEAAGTAS